MFTNPNTLKYFPLIMYAFQLILDDQPYPPQMNVHIDGNAEVPKNMLYVFRRAEEALSNLYGKKIRDLNLSKELLKQYKQELRPQDDAFACTVLPVDDTAEALYASAGISKLGGKLADKVLYEFFDGDLREIFQKGHINQKRSTRGH